MSRNIKWGIKRGFEKGTSGYAEFVCFGYKRGDDGKLVIDGPDAEIVRKMFEVRVAGSSLGAISEWLYENKIISPTGKLHKQQSDCFSLSDISLTFQIIVPQGILRKINFDRLLQVHIIRICFR